MANSKIDSICRDKYRSLADEFLLPPNIPDFSRKSRQKSGALAFDMSFIKDNSRGPGEFLRIMTRYLNDRPSIVSALSNEGKEDANDIAQRFTVITLVEQEFRVTLHELNIDLSDVDLDIDDSDLNGLGIAVGFDKSVPNMTAAIFRSKFHKRLSQYFNDDSGGRILSLSSDKDDPNDISEFMEHIDSNIKGEA
jgi:hypothetical protein